MALDKNKVAIPLGQGLDTKTDPKQVEPGRLLTLENAVFLKNGMIQKCNGFASKRSAASFSENALGCGTLKDNFFTVTDGKAYSYSPSRDETTVVGRYLPITVTRSNGIAQDPKSVGCAYDSTTNSLFYAWQELDVAGTNTIKMMGVDAATSAVNIPEIYINAGTKPRITTSTGIDYYLMVYTSAAGDLIAIAMRKDFPSISTYKIATIDTAANYDGFGYSLYASGSNIYCAYSTGAGANTKVVKFDPTYASFAITATLTLTGSSSKCGSAMIASSGLWIFTTSETQLKVIIYSTDLSTLVSASRTIMTVPGYATRLSGAVVSATDSGNIQVFSTIIDGTALDEMPRINQAIITSTTVVEAQRDFIVGASLAGDMIRRAGSGGLQYYLPITVLQSYDPSNVGTGYKGFYTLYLLRVSQFDNTPQDSYVAAKFYDLNAPEIWSTTGHPDYINFLGTSFGTFGLIKEKTGNASLANINFTHKPIFAELANNLHVTGGYLGMYDGMEFAEHNFFQQPVQCKLTQSAGAGSIAAGTYYYSYTYQWQDSYGQIHESSPSDPVQTVLASAKNVTVACSTVHLTNRTTQIYIAIYRSTDGVLFQLLPGTGINSPVQSFKNNLVYNFLDSTTAAQIAAQPFLYTSGGELNNISAPACLSVAVFKRRLTLVPSEDQNSIWYSKEIIPAQSGTIGTPVSFVSEFVLSVDERGGTVTGTIQLDDKLVIFKPNTISIVTGEGPANNGAQNDFSTPQIIAADTGALYSRSLVITPLGIMFQSPKGFYLLDRSLSVSYIGAPVEAFNSRETLAAVLMADRNEIWFACTSGDVLVFNYYFTQWSVIKWATTHACVYQSKFTSVSGFLIYQETPGAYQRDGAGYAMKVTTGWLSFADIQGFQRIYKLLLLGDYKSAHRLQVQVAVNFDDAIVQTSTFAADVTTPYQYRIFMTRQKGESIKFTIQDLAPTAGSWNEGYTLGNMAMEVGIKRSLNKLPATASKG